MAVDHAGGGADATIETAEEPLAAEQPPPPDRPGAEGAPSRAESRHAAVSEQVNDQPIEDKPVEEEPKGSTPPLESSAEQDGEATQDTGEHSEPSDSPVDGARDQASTSTSETTVEQLPRNGVEDDDAEQPLGSTGIGTAEESGGAGSAAEADGHPVPERSEDPAAEGQPAPVDSDAETPAKGQDSQQAPSAEDEVPADPDAAGRKDDVESAHLPQTHDEDTASGQTPSDDPRDADRAAAGEDDEAVIPAEVPGPVRKEDVREEAVQEAATDGHHTGPREAREDASGSETNRDSPAQGGGEVFGSSGSVENQAWIDQADRPDAAVDRPLYPEVTDRADYVFTDREYAFVEVSPEQAWDMHEQRAPPRNATRAVGFLRGRAARGARG